MPFGTLTQMSRTRTGQRCYSTPCFSPTFSDRSPTTLLAEGPRRDQQSAEERKEMGGDHGDDERERERDGESGREETTTEDRGRESNLSLRRGAVKREGKVPLLYKSPGISLLSSFPSFYPFFSSLQSCKKKKLSLYETVNTSVWLI